MSEKENISSVEEAEGIVKNFMKDLQSANVWLNAAARAGVKIELDIVDVSTMGCKVPMYLIDAKPYYLLDCD
jgi:hypothetical protein